MMMMLYSFSHDFHSLKCARLATRFSLQQNGSFNQIHLYVSDWNIATWVMCYVNAMQCKNRTVIHNCQLLWWFFISAVRWLVNEIDTSFRTRYLVRVYVCFFSSHFFLVSDQTHYTLLNYEHFMYACTIAYKVKLHFTKAKRHRECI